MFVSPSLENIPLADPNEARWANIMDRCDPLLHTVALVGISAVQHGVEQAQNARASEFVASGQLLDGAGNLNSALSSELDINSYPRPDHMDTAIGGLCIVSAVAHVSRFLTNRTAKNQDYTGQTGVNFTKRTVVASADSLQQSIQLGKKLGCHPISNVQAQVFKPTEENANKYKSTDLGLAASMYGLEPGSMSSRLMVEADLTENRARASITSGSREGDFVYADVYPKFEDLRTYTKLISELV